MRISDCNSDVCSSDLRNPVPGGRSGRSRAAWRRAPGIWDSVCWSWFALISGFLIFRRICVSGDLPAHAEQGLVACLFLHALLERGNQFVALGDDLVLDGENFLQIGRAHV